MAAQWFVSDLVSIENSERPFNILGMVGHSGDPRALRTIKPRFTQEHCESLVYRLHHLARPSNVWVLTSVLESGCIFGHGGLRASHGVMGFAPAKSWRAIIFWAPCYG